jgi:hypothetical protein
MGQQSFASVALAAASVLGTGPCLAQAQAWAIYTDDRGTRIEYPSHIFSVPRGGSGPGRVLETPDGRARLHMYSMPNARALSPSTFMQMEFPADRSRLTYDRVARNFFAISSRRGNMIIYLRCNFSTNAAGSLHCVDLRYPSAEKRAWDAVVTRVSRSLRPFPSAR